jgi:adenine-specific DNA methylase
MADRPRVLIEDWLPITELGIESRREAAPIPGQFPKLKTLHVWWARRPLAASAGAVLGSVMPAWTTELATEFPEATELGSQEQYQAWFLRLCGVLGDPIAAKVRIAEATARGKTLGAQAYGYKQAFKNSPTTSDLDLLHRLLMDTWGKIPSVLDPTAGGGSIPYESIRYGLPTTANDLNPVAASILRAGVQIPAKFGDDLRDDLQRWGDVLTSRVQARLTPYFQIPDTSNNNSYLFARTVACPRTGKPVPMAPNWWLSKQSGKEAAVRLMTERDGRALDQAEFEIVTGKAAWAANPDRGTVAGGDAISPWDNIVIEGNYIKAEAQAGRMGSQLYAVATRINGKRGFRAPTQTDLDALDAAEAELRRLEPEWAATNILPTEEVPPGNDLRPLHYGMPRWRDLFSPRQLLVHGTFVEEFRQVVKEVRAEAGDRDRANAVLALLGLLVGKGVDWNSHQSTWHASRTSMAHTYMRHDLAFRPAYAEFEGARELYPWCLEQLVDAYVGIAALLPPSDASAMHAAPLAHPVPGPVAITCGNAGDLAAVADGSQVLVCIDPPYSDNVMYAELADFFYVWEKRTTGLVWPELFGDDLTDKTNEAVANQARFSDAGRRGKTLAISDYQAKMQAIFAECHRVLREDGVMTVMFTHKTTDAWDALGSALMTAGFTIEASWPVNTESEQSIHQAKKNAAASTIMLVCRQRTPIEGGAFFEDLEPEVRAAARRAHSEFAAKGIGGVDLLLATYGPALSVISSRWPVYSSEADSDTGRSRLLRPEEALDSARAEVTKMQRERLVGGEQRLDPVTDFVMVAWDTFQAREFPFDEARRLALAVGGLDVDELARAKVLEKKSGTVTLLPPEKRVRRLGDQEAGLSGVYPEATEFLVALDAVQTAMHIASVDGLSAAKAFLDRTRLLTDGRFLAALQGLVTAIPRTKTSQGWVVPEAAILDQLCTAYFPTVRLPVKEESEQVEELALFEPDGDD